MTSGNEPSTDPIGECKPPSLRQRALEDAERISKNLLAENTIKLRLLLVEAGIDPYGGEVHVKSRTVPRIEIEGVAFSIGKANDYDERTGEYRNVRDCLDAALACSVEGCHETVYHSSIREVRRVGDLARLFHPDRAMKCGRDHTRPVAEDDDDLSDLPF